MLKNIPLLSLLILFLANTANAAGTMENVTQDISLNNAEIISGAASSGGSSSAFFGVVQVQKSPGEITIGRITNEGGTMKNVSQTIRANNAHIHSNGAAITIGEISNK